MKPMILAALLTLSLASCSSFVTAIGAGIVGTFVSSIPDQFAFLRKFTDPALYRQLVDQVAIYLRSHRN